MQARRICVLTGQLLMLTFGKILLLSKPYTQNTSGSPTYKALQSSALLLALPTKECSVRKYLLPMHNLLPGRGAADAAVSRHDDLAAIILLPQRRVPQHLVRSAELLSVGE